MKFVVLQDVPYRRPEGALAQYHGIIWAEELRRRGHEATKMVVGDPAAITPECPLLSVSTAGQRRDPSFWRELGADCVLYYCGANESSLRVICAIKSGSPRTVVVARIEGYGAPENKSIRAALGRIPARYITNRHCPTEGFGLEKSSVAAASVKTALQVARELMSGRCAPWIETAEAADAMTFFFPSLVRKAAAFMSEHGRGDLVPKLKYAGYPVRPEFRPAPDVSKTPCSVVSVANWRHVKDPELTADAMSIALENNPDATYTVIGMKSDRVARRIVGNAPSVAGRVQSFEHIDNWKIPEFFASAQVFLQCSYKEGIPSVLSEALCCGCSLALAPSPACGAFSDYASNGCGTVAKSRSAHDVADAVSREFEAWRTGARTPSTLADKWNGTRVSSLCDSLIELVSAAKTGTRPAAVN